MQEGEEGRALQRQHGSCSSSDGAHGELGTGGHFKGFL